MEENYKSKSAWQVENFLEYLADNIYEEELASLFLPILKTKYAEQWADFCVLEGI